MSRSISSHRHARSAGKALIAAVVVAFMVALAVPSVAGAGGNGPVAPPPPNPTSADQIQNIDQVRTAIKGYYGDTVTTAVDPVPNTVDGRDVVLHTFSPTGAYVDEVAELEEDALRYLTQVERHPRASEHRAIVLDVDDTTLNTYNYEIYSNFAYNPTINGYFVDNAVFPAVPGMPELVDTARGLGYEVFFLTGRPESQRAGTTANLASEGYGTVDPAHLFLKTQDLEILPWLRPCSPGCTSAQYKALTRQHLVDEGFDVVANFGDQPSDFTGGFADEVFQLPNPMYYLP